MIDPKELRIGNFIEPLPLVNKNTKWHTIVVIYNDCVYASDYQLESIYSKDILPCIISEFWLFNFGFQKLANQNNHWVINDPNGFKDSHKISIFPTINDQWQIAFSDTLSEYKDYIPTTKIKYVHQLQNLYFALTGLELEIKI